MVLVLAESALGPFDHDIWQVIASIRLNLEHAALRELVEWSSLDDGVGLLAWFASVVDDRSIAGVDSVVCVSETMTENVIAFRHRLSRRWLTHDG